jgi:hypothetical protein
VSPAVRATISGLVVAGAVLLIALVISEPNTTTVVLAIAIGLAVALTAWYQGRRA